MFDGVYISGSILGIPVDFTVDTGATRTIVSDEVYYRIPNERRPALLKPRKGIRTANGGRLVVHGSSTFDIQLGEVSLNRELMVAEIDDEVLLGADLLQRDASGPADLLLSEEVMRFRDHTIPLFQSKRKIPANRRVRSADHYIVPGMSEMIIEAFIGTLHGSTEENSLVLIEPHPQLAERCSLVLASSVVSFNNGPTVKMRVLNPFEEPASIKQDMVVGLAEGIDSRECQTLTSIRPDNSSQDRIRRLINKQLDTTRIPSHLQVLCEETIVGHDPEQQEVILGMLQQFSEVFSKDNDDLGMTHMTKHEIDTGNARPFKQPPHRVPTAFAGEDTKAIEKLQRQGVIRPSSSPWASPIVLVHKKDGSVRFCTDYRRLNQCTKKDAFPIPRTEDCIDAVAGASIFSTMDITSAYHQIPVHENDIPKTAFVTKYGLFEYVTMPFGLCNATATFQRLMELALSGLQWSSCLIYLDDVIVFSKDFHSHISRLAAVLTKIQQAGLKLKPSKCRFLRNEVNFLGHVISEKGILPNPDNIKKVAEWPLPRSVKEVRSFLGLGNYYRRFVKNYSKLAKPLTELTKRNLIFSWTPRCQEAFDQLKNELTGPEVMAYPSDDGEYILDCDACDVSIGCVLSQVQNQKERVIAYGSRTLNKAERNYCVTDKELLAVKHFIENYKHYLLGRKFLVRSDHQALKWLFSLKEPKSRIARWIEILSAFDFEVEYRKGTQHGNADALSRCPDPKICACLMEGPLKCGPCPKCIRKTDVMQGIQHGYVIDQVRSVAEGTKGYSNNDIGDTPDAEVVRQAAVRWLSPYSSKVLKSKQAEDPDIGPIMQWKEAGNRPRSEAICPTSPATRSYWHYWDSLELVDGVLLRRFTKKNNTGSHLQLLVPRSLRDEVLHQMHDTVMAGHLGQKKTREKTLQRFFWHGIREDINLWCMKCDVCAATKMPSKTIRAPLGKMSTGAPWDRLGIDILGPFPVSEKGNKYILVVTDHFSKWVEIFAIPDQTAVTCAEVLLNEVIARYGCPYEILSDQGRNFESKIFSELCELLEIRKKRTSPANPRCNGQVERFNRTLVRMIKAYLKGQQLDWDRRLGCLAAAYRATVNESTGLSPNLIMLGREVRLPAEIMFGSRKIDPSQGFATYGDFVWSLRDRMQHAHDVTRTHLELSATRQKEYYDLRSTLQVYHPGDLVWCLSALKQLKITPKLRNPYEGPYLVLKKFNELNYLVQFGANGPQRVMHYNKLKPHHGDGRLTWVRTAMRRFIRAQ